MQFPKHILSGICKNKSYAKKVFPFLKKDYFLSYEEGYLFNLIKKYVITYKTFPTSSTLKLELTKQTDLNENGYQLIQELIEEIFNIEFDYTEQWLVDTTEVWIQERSIHLALEKCIELKTERKNLDAIPDILRKALQVSFNTTCGFEIFDEKSIDERFNLYKRKIKKFPTGIDKLDFLTGGGLEAKAVTCWFGGTGVGKSVCLVSVAANMAREGEDVLYVTLEMSEEKISQRFEANLLDVFINDVGSMEEAEYKGGLSDIKKRGIGRIAVKEFPTASININHIEALLDELEIKKGFKPTVLAIDYVNLMKSARVSGDTLYSTVKAIIEEIRGLAVSRELCIITATQANKDGNNSKISDIEINHISESKALADTCDCVIGMIYPEELREQNIQVFKLLKNRFGGLVGKKIAITTEHEKSKILNCEQEFEMNDEVKDDKKEKLKSKRKKVEMNFKDAQLDEDLWN